MRRAAYYSAGLHLGIVFFAAVIWPLLDFDREMPEPIMPVEIVASLPQSKAEPTPEPKAEPAPEPPKEAKPEPPTPTPPTPPPPQPPAPKVEQQPEAIPLPKPQPPKPEPPKETAQPQPPEPQVRPVVKEKPEPPTPNKNLMASVLKTVEKLDQEQKKANDKPAPKTETQTTPTPNATVSNLDRTRREAQLGDLVRQQIKQCWNVPAGAKDIQNMVVEIRMQLGPDGAVQRVEPRDPGRMGSDPFYRTLAESAMRAVLNPRCNPLKLPSDSYDIWRDMTLTFNPKDLV
ncbi:MAG: cell envelope integrity protein TolA [Alphaproteobacteria bacterium]